MRFSLKQEMANIAKKDGRVDVISGMLAFPNKTKAQVLSALNNASSDGLIHVVAHLEGNGHGLGPAIFAPGRDPRKAYQTPPSRMPRSLQSSNSNRSTAVPAARSVWDLAK